MAGGREFQIVRAATLKPQTPNKMRTNGMDSRLVFDDLREPEQKSLALASMARDDPPASSSTAAAMRGKAGLEFET